MNNDNDADDKTSSRKYSNAKKAAAPIVNKKVTLKKTRPGQKTISFKPGGLHASTGTPQGQKIPASKLAAARSGKLGPKAEKQELFRENVLTGRGKS